MKDLKARLKELGITPAINKIECPQDDGIILEYEYFTEDKNENIRINYLTPTGQKCQYEKEGILMDFYRTRFVKPKDEKTKYGQPPASGTHPFITPGIIKRFQKKEDIETLFIVEGEFKAFKGDMIGLDIIGIGGIHSYKDKERGELDPMIQQIVKERNVRNIVLIQDADCLTVEYVREKDLYKRPYSFYTAVMNFAELCKPLNLDVYFTHIKIEYIKTAKGLDDLIIHLGDKYKQLKSELYKFTTDAEKKHVECFNLTGSSYSKVKDYFGVNGATVFYDKYKHIIGDKEFVYNNAKYYYNGEKIIISWYGQAQGYIRVGCDYYKKVLDKNAHGECEEVLKDWSIAEINRDFNNSKEFVRDIPRFDKFCNIPDNTESYKRVVIIENEQIKSRLFNRYNPLDHEPKQGEWKYIEKFLRHIFNTVNLDGENLYEFGLDYIQHLYYNPLQRLPVICLVSAERNTGKSTFLEFLRLIFKENMAILDNERFTGKFTSHFIDKLVISVDEGFIPIEQKLMKERIKNFATGKKQWLEAKGRPAQELDYYGKLILCSNDEHNFMQIDSGENRFAVIKVSSIKEDDPMLVQKMRSEIPFFIHYLKTRKLHYPVNISRFSFDTKVYMTESMKNVVERTAPRMEKEFKEFIYNEFVKHRFDKLEFAAIDIVEEINKESSIKYSKSQIIDYCKFQLNIVPQRLKKYKIYSYEYNDLSKRFDTNVKQIKAGRPYAFYAQEYIPASELAQMNIQTNQTDDEMVQDDFNQAQPIQNNISINPTAEPVNNLFNNDQHVF